MRNIAYWMTLFMIFAIPWANFIDVSGVGTIGKMIGLVAAVCWIEAVICRGEFRRPHAFHLVCLLFVTWNAASLLWTIDLDATTDRTLTYIQTFGFVYIVWDLFTTESKVRAAFQAYILGAMVALGSLLMNYQAASQEGFQRISATATGENEMALILALAMPVAWYLAITGSRGFLGIVFKLVNFAFIPAAFMGIFLTASRSGFLAMVPTCLFMLASLMHRKPQQVIVAITVLVGISIALVPMIPERTLLRITSSGEELRADSLDGRWAIWREAIEVIADQPFLGVGSFAFRAAANETGKITHNFALSLFAELGVIGLLLFVLLLVIVVWEHRRLPVWNRWFWATILVSWLVMNLTHNFEHLKTTWFFLSIAIASVFLSVSMGRNEDIDETKLIVNELNG